MISPSLGSIEHIICLSDLSDYGVCLCGSCEDDLIILRSFQ